MKFENNQLVCECGNCVFHVEECLQAIEFRCENCNAEYGLHALSNPISLECIVESHNPKYSLEEIRTISQRQWEN
jgi:hypothetical protein